MLDVAQKHDVSNPRPRRAEDIVEPGVVEIGAADAALILRECRYPRQTRDLTVPGQQHISVLADLMRRKEWRNFEKIDFADVGGRLYIVNGYHRLGAQIASGARIKWIFVIHKCATEDEAVALYQTFDTNVKARSINQILTVIDAAEILGVSRVTVSAVYRAVPLIIAGFDFRRVASDPLMTRVIDARMGKVRSLQNQAIAWEKATKKAPGPIKRRLSTQGALATALMCFKQQPAAAEEFWRGVSENDGLVKGDPRRAYLYTLQGSNTARGSAYTLAMQAAVAWNAWFENRTLNMVKIATNARFRLSGTSFIGL